MSLTTLFLDDGESDDIEYFKQGKDDQSYEEYGTDDGILIFLKYLIVEILSYINELIRLF